MTRIVAGLAGGRRLDVPPGGGTRPTSDRVREALFSAIEAAVDLDGARVLDLYAGSGALGLEALSRGAATATFVESNARAVTVLRRNVSALGFDMLGSDAEVITGKVETVLGRPAETSYDLVLADPPYAVADDALAAVLTLLSRNGWTVDGTLVVVERDRRSGAPEWPVPLRPSRTRRYGDTELHWAEHLTEE
ncbi:16S rRNA (guanine966-N2)-methyltransferase [Herbihabitans rhizosphaerae]|uniref:16S rRNA (Guanine966-N2)-methyltransferase n=1 Tax=Herbihabitans rhizosphaerae TaxID=1872711 RepID=A0A4Q7KR30_9PSEU|nr:16S rRNA (guanine(966)-N(2))-methyltransferase RsmD [Herbihabitans rhizosphaerae]RZS39299.1 16S rRNA (guanine966-N2)-methyltransferase [Herbihabitans rhizosphaerae]